MDAARTPVGTRVGGPARAAASAADSMPASPGPEPGTVTVSPGTRTVTRSGPASEPRIRMNPQGAIVRLVQCPSPACVNPTDNCIPRTSSGTTIRAPGPEGPACATQAGARSLTPTVAITRSYGAPSGQPSAPSAHATVTSAYPALSRCSRAAPVRSLSMSTVTTEPEPP